MSSKKLAIAHFDFHRVRPSDIEVGTSPQPHFQFISFEGMQQLLSLVTSSPDPPSKRPTILAMLSPSEIKPVTFHDIYMLWQGMLVVYGMWDLVGMINSGIENLRETLMKLAVLWIEDDEKLQIVKDTVQILTVLGNMTGHAQMDGEHSHLVEFQCFKLSVWQEASETFNVRQPTEPGGFGKQMVTRFLRTKDLEEMLLREVKMSRRELETLCNLCSERPQLLVRFESAGVLLEHVTAFIHLADRSVFS